MSNHWAGEKKSYAVKFLDDDSPFKRDRVNFIIPQDKGYFLESFNLSKAKHFGLKIVGNDFAKLKINGEEPLVYWMTEKFDEVFLAQNELPEKIDLFADRDHTYSHFHEVTLVDGNQFDTPYIVMLANLLSSAAYFDQKMSFGYFDSNDYSSVYLAVQILQGMNSTDDLFKIFDRDNLLAVNAVNKLTGAHHFRNNDNWVSYFDHTVGKFFFLPWDILDNYDLSYDAYVNRGESYESYLDNWVFYLANLDADYRRDLDALMQEYKVSFFEEDIDLMDSLKKVFHSNYAKEAAKISTVKEFRRIMDHSVDMEADIMEAMLDNRDLEPHSKYTKGVTADNFTGHYSFLEERDGKFFITDDVVLEKDFFVPEGVEVYVSPGVKLFLENAVRIVSLGKLNFLGTPHNRIEIWPISENGSWDYVMYLNPSSSGSRIEYTDFIRGGDGISVAFPGTYITGPLNAFFTDVLVKDIRLINNRYDNYPLSYRRNINIVNSLNEDGKITGFEISPDTYLPVRIGGINIEGDFDRLVDPNGRYVRLEDLANNVLVSRSLTQFTDLDDWQDGQEVPFAYKFEFIGSEVEDVDFQFVDVQTDIYTVDIPSPEKMNTYTINEVEVHDGVFEYFDRIDESVEMFLKRYPDVFESEEDENVVVRGGVYQIDEDIIIPQGLEVVFDPGVVFELAEGVSMLSYSPVIAKGVEDNKIVFKGQVDNVGEEVIWGAFGIIGDDEFKSEFEYVNFQDGSEAYMNGIYMPGMLTVNHQEVYISNSSFGDSYAESALSLSYSDGTVSGSSFVENDGYGVFWQFARGDMNDNDFKYNKDGAIHFYGGEAGLDGNNIFDSGDKCVFVDYGAKVSLNGGSVQNCDNGVYVRDGSNVEVKNTGITDNDTGVKLDKDRYYFDLPSVEIKGVDLDTNDEPIDNKFGAKVSILDR